MSNNEREQTWNQLLIKMNGSVGQHDDATIQMSHSSMENNSNATLF